MARYCNTVLPCARSHADGGEVPPARMVPSWPSCPAPSAPDQLCFCTHLFCSADGDEVLPSPTVAARYDAQADFGAKGDGEADDTAALQVGSEVQAGEACKPSIGWSALCETYWGWRGGKHWRRCGRRSSIGGFPVE